MGNKITLGSLMGAIPGRWDKLNCCISLKHGKNCVIRIPYLRSRTFPSAKILPGIYLLLQVANILYLTLFLLFLEHSTIDMYLCSPAMFCFLYTIAAQLHFYLHFESLVNSVNSFLILDSQIRKY
jgi:hypothetical protein